ncbi:hypothetical protein DDI_4098 [Dickeya dianthicola RNS04.9]|nr:hypothetical protein DDI_4098 [Dickeya dianthicola RNS04.9]
MNVINISRISCLMRPVFSRLIKNRVTEWGRINSSFCDKDQQ